MATASSLLALGALGCGHEPRESGNALDAGSAPRTLASYLGPHPFVDITASAFAPADRVSGWPSLALFDFDDDGDIDVFVGNDGGRANLLYQNDGHGNFRDVAVQAGIAFPGEWAMAVGVGDFDNDGFLDLLLGTQIKPASVEGDDNAISRVRYLQNLGPDAAEQFHFVDLTREVGLGSLAHVSSFGVGDFDGDGALDLYAGRYDLRDITFSLGSYLPDTPNAFFRNRRLLDGYLTFEDLTSSAKVEGARIPGLAPSSASTLGVTPTWATYVSDIDDDGLLDILVAHEVPGGVDVFLNQGGMKFRQLEDEWLRLHGGWMGVCAADVERRGSLAYFVTNVGADFPVLHPGQHNVADSPAPPEGTPFHRLLAWQAGVGFSDLASAVAVEPGPLPPRNTWNGQGLAAYEFGFGCAWLDVDNDGWLDLTWTGDLPLSTSSGPGRPDFHGVSRLLRNHGRLGFSDQTATLGLFPWSPELPLEFGYARAGRALLVADLDGDGFEDICRTYYDRNENRGDNLQCLRSPGGNGHWLNVRLRGHTSNRFGIGAKVEVTTGGLTSVAEISTTTSSFGAVQPQAHFGLGEASHAERVLVRWPSGQRSQLFDTAADRTLLIEEP